MSPYLLKLLVKMSAPTWGVPVRIRVRHHYQGAPSTVPVLWIYPTQFEINCYAACAAQPVTRYWGEWYIARLESARTLRALALAYSE